MLRDSIRGSFAREAPVATIRDWADTEDMQPFHELAARQGWYGIGVGEDAGGQGGGMLERAILHEELGRAAAPSAALAAAAMALDLLGEDPEADGLVSAIVDGERQVALAIPAGRPLDRPAIDFRADSEVLDGSTELALNAINADLLIVPVWDHDEATLWAVGASAAGVTRHRRILIDRARSVADISLEHATGNRLRSVSAAALTHALARAAVLSAAESLGAARQLLEMTVGYARQREQFGVAIGSFQAVKHAAAQALVDIEAAHSGVYFAAWSLEQDHPEAELHAWTAKAFSADMGARTADVALQLHGAIGYTWEYDLQVFFKRAKVNQQLLGSPRHYRGLVADALRLAG